MKKILILYDGREVSAYDGREVPAFLLARFDMVENEFVCVRGLFGRKKEVLSPIKRQYCLVFIPWKHREKELALIATDDAVTMEKIEGEGVVFAESFVSPFTKEAPYYAEYKISSFVGYDFIYEYKSFIGDVRNQCGEKPLELLYRYAPELLCEEFDEADAE